MTRSTVRAAAIAATVLLALTLGCGGGGGRDNPERPTIDVEATSQLVDVGQQYHLDASGSFDPTGHGLTYFWTLTPPTDSDAKIQDHCETDFDEICIENTDACSDDATKDCTTNSDCRAPGCDPDVDDCAVCVEDRGQTSPQCTEGRCEVNQGRQEAVVTFVADKPGPYSIRVLVESSDANDSATTVLDTYPSLYLLGSLFEFGGTGGGLVDQFPDADTFAADAVALATNPVTGNLLLALTGPPGRVREFSYRDGTDLGVFGETVDFVQAPVALTFSNDDRLLIAQLDGSVRVFDSARGRFIGTLTDVTAGTEEVAAIAVSPVTNNLIVVDGRAGQPVRQYNSATGALEGVFGDVGTVATQAIDLAFLQGAVFVADAGGDLVRCTNAELGTGCSVVPAAASLLQVDGPTSIAVNPAADVTDADIVIADAVAKAVIACSSDGSACELVTDTQGLDSDYLDLAFAPAVTPTPEPPPMFTTTTTPPTTTTVP